MFVEASPLVFDQTQYSKDLFGTILAGGGRGADRSNIGIGRCTGVVQVSADMHTCVYAIEQVGFMKFGILEFWILGFWNFEIF